MATSLKILTVDAGSGYYKMSRFPLGDFFGPVDLGLFLAGRQNSLNIGTGLLAGSIFPGSNRLVFTGFSPCWGGFFVSTMGGAGLVFDNLGLNMLSITGRAPSPSILYLNRVHGEEVQLELRPVDTAAAWETGRRGVYGMMELAIDRFGARFETAPRVLATGPGAATTDFGAIASAPVKDSHPTFVDTWAGRGGFGSKLLREHGIAAIIYGGTVVDEDFRDRKVADEWFEARYQKKLAAKDFDATVKYRFDPKLGTGGTFGVNYSTLKGRLLSFNYRSIYLSESERLEIHDKLIAGHYLKQFNEETIATKSQHTCGEPCPAVCKKMRGEYKKDYEPYQTMGPLCGIFDQRAAELVNHHADSYGLDAISAGGVLAWMMELLADGKVKPEEFGASEKPVFSHKGFAVETDSMHNARIAVDLLDAIVERKGLVNLDEGARKFGRRLARDRGKEMLDGFVYSSFGRKGWMVPNQYWTPGVLSPMPIMGKYYMYYGAEFLEPRVLGRVNAGRMKEEFVMDNLGMCRFHRGWAEEMLPEILQSLWGVSDAFKRSLAMTASRINSRNASVFWEPARNTDFIRTFLKRRVEVENDLTPETAAWLKRFEEDGQEAALSFWFDTLKGIHESLREF